MLQPSVLILKADGINCEEETRFAFELAGGQAWIVHVNELRSGNVQWRDYAIVCIPGGFSYGDDIASGRVLSNELLAYFRDELKEYVAKGGLVLGICNGFQVLIRMGLLPFATLGQMQATLTVNRSGSFECRWVELVPTGAWCAFTAGIKEPIVLPVANGEGRISASVEVLLRLEGEKLIPLRYGREGTPTQVYPYNPNGSAGAIAALADSTGHIFGLMPHPERFVMNTQHPNWRREKFARPHGLAIFENAITYASGL